jgi:hypothetical protein
MEVKKKKFHIAVGGTSFPIWWPLMILAALGLMVVIVMVIGA